MGDDTGWDKIWDGLDNEKNWNAEKYRTHTAGSLGFPQVLGSVYAFEW